MPKASNPPAKNAIQKKQNTTVLIVILCILLIVIINLLKGYLSQGPKDVSRMRTKGDPNAPVKIVEYIDFQCPACARGVAMLNQYYAAYPKKLYLQMKYFPLDGHQHAQLCARYAECAARQGKFWPFHDLLIARQNDWKGLINADPIFQEIGTAVGLDKLKLEVCLTNDEVKSVILREKENGVALGIQSTPTYFINDQMFVGIKSLESELKTRLGELPSMP